MPEVLTGLQWSPQGSDAQICLYGVLPLRDEAKVRLIDEQRVEISPVRLDEPERLVEEGSEVHGGQVAARYALGDLGKSGQQAVLDFIEHVVDVAVARVERCAGHGHGCAQSLHRYVVRALTGVDLHELVAYGLADFVHPRPLECL